MKPNKRFYEEKSWGAASIKEAKDLPNLKLRYCMEMIKDSRGSLLEIGCGSGRILSSIRDRNKNINLTGIDLSRKQISLANSMNTDIKFVRGNGEKLPFRDNSFDYVIIMDFLEHIEHPDKALREVHRVLKKGGRLYASVPAEGERWSIYHISKRIFKRHFKEETVGHIQQYTIKRLESMIRKQKLMIEREYFSYHLLGSIMDYTMFTMLLNKNIAKVFWSKNKYYHKNTKQSIGSRILNGLMTIGNGIAYYESATFKRTRMTATNVHIVARKGGR